MIGLPEVPTFQYTMASSGEELAERSSDGKLAVDVGQAAADLLGSQELAETDAMQLEVGSSVDETQRCVIVNKLLYFSVSKGRNLIESMDAGKGPYLAEMRLFGPIADYSINRCTFLWKFSEPYFFL